jgi:hypothetical protein
MKTYKDGILEAAMFCVDRGVLAEGGKLLTDLRALAAQEDQRVPNPHPDTYPAVADHPTTD